MNSFGIKENSGDIIGKNVSVVINEISHDWGLTLVTQNHIKENNNPDENLDSYHLI